MRDARNVLEAFLNFKVTKYISSVSFSFSESSFLVLVNGCSENVDPSFCFNASIEA